MWKKEIGNCARIVTSPTISNSCFYFAGTAGDHGLKKTVNYPFLWLTKTLGWGSFFETKLKVNLQFFILLIRKILCILFKLCRKS